MAGKKKAKKVTKVAKKATRRGKATSAVAKRRVQASSKPRRAARRTRDAIMAILEEAKSRGSNAVVIRKHKLSPTTFYSWKRKFVVSRRKRSK